MKFIKAHPIINKVLAMGMLILLMLQMVPLYALAQAKGTAETQTTAATTDTTQLPTISTELLPSETTPSDEEGGSSEGQSNLRELTDEETNDQSSEPEAPDKAADIANGDLPLAVTDLTQYIAITNWDILDSTNNPVSLTNPAQAGKPYSFKFSWKLTLPNGNHLADGDQLKIPMPSNANNGYWTAQASSETEFKDQSSGDVMGKWKVVNGTNPDTGEKENYFLVTFSNVDNKRINVLEGLTFETVPGSFSNYTLKGQTQTVSFGGETFSKPVSPTKTDPTIRDKEIAFIQHENNPLNGWSYKYFASSTNRMMYYQIATNPGGLNELGGDERDSQTKWIAKENGQPIPHYWGEFYSQTNSFFVTDELDPGVTLSALSIVTQIRIPTTLTDENYADKKGGIMGGAVALELPVLYDAGRGPIYNDDGTQSSAPKQANSFKELKQTEGETADAFKTRLKSTVNSAQEAYYGFYYDATTNKRTLMIEYGKFGEQSFQKKYSELTDQREAASGRKIQTRDGQTVPILDFAVQAADNTISKGYYDESDRQKLEDYYTLTYGDSNAIGGTAASYLINLRILYPKTESGEKTNIVSFDIETTRHGAEKHATATGELDNPYALVLTGRSALLLKSDADTGNPIDGAKFKLQKKSGNSWVDVAGSEELTKTWTHNEVLLEGAILKESLADGTYRFVETEPNPIYVGSGATSEEFTIDSNNATAIVEVKNRRKTVSKFEFTKKGKTADGTEGLLEGAKFEFYKWTGTGNPPQNTEGAVIDPYEGNGNWTRIDAGESDSKGKVSLDFSDAGLYLLKETEVPAGYERVINGGWTIDVTGTTGNLSMGEIIARQGRDARKYPIQKVQNFATGGAEGNVLVNNPTINWKFQKLDEDGQPMSGVTFKLYTFDHTNLYEVNEGKTFTWTGNGSFANTTDEYPNYYMWSKNPGPDTEGNKPYRNAGWAQDDSVRTVTSDENGWVEFTDLPKDFYRLEETAVSAAATAAGYVPIGSDAFWLINGSVNSSGDPRDVAVSVHRGSGVSLPSNIERTGTTGNYTYTLKNIAKKQLTLKKQNVNEKALSGAKFTLYRWNYGASGTPVPDWGGLNPADPNWTNGSNRGPIVETSDIQGLFSYQLTVGEIYLLKETGAPDGYQAIEGYWGIKVNADGTIETKPVDYPAGVSPPELNEATSGSDYQYYIVNHKTEPATTEFQFFKVDENDNALRGTEFTLYKPKEGVTINDTNCDPTKSETGWDIANPVQTKKSESGSGRVLFTGIKMGDYLLMETKTREGYQLPAGQWWINVNAQTDVVTIRKAIGTPPAFKEMDDGEWQVRNYRNFVLPEAGGIGMIILTILGIVLVGVGIILRLINKNSSQKNKD